MGKFVKLVVYVPQTHGEKIRRVLAGSGCGRMGKYDSCSFSVKGVGRFRPLKGSRPFVGRVGKIEKVKEERIETICPKAKLKMMLEAVRKAHPYEEPAVDVYALIL